MTWAPDYITTAELKAYVRVGDSLDDAELALAVTAASRAVDDWCNRQFGAVSAPAERIYTGWYDKARDRWYADIDDLMTTTGFTLAVDGTSVTEYSLEPANAAADGRPWTRLAFTDDSEAFPEGITDEIAITATWGWTAVPSAVKLATRLQASRFASRRDSPYGVAGSPSEGSEMRLLAKVDPDVAVALKGLTRPRWAA